MLKTCLTDTCLAETADVGCIPEVIAAMRRHQGLSPNPSIPTPTPQTPNPKPKPFASCPLLLPQPPSLSPPSLPPRSLSPLLSPSLFASVSCVCMCVRTGHEGVEQQGRGALRSLAREHASNAALIALSIQVI